MWHEIAFSEGKRRRSFFQVAVSGWEKQRNGYRMGSGGCREMYDLVLKEGMWHEIAFSEGKRRRSFFQVAVSGWEKQRNGYRMGDRKSTRLNSSHQLISYAVFCLKKKTKKKQRQRHEKKGVQEDSNRCGNE